MEKAFQRSYNFGSSPSSFISDGDDLGRYCLWAAYAREYKEAYIRVVSKMRVSLWIFGIAFFLFGMVATANTRTMIEAKEELHRSNMIAADLITLSLHDLAEIQI